MYYCHYSARGSIRGSKDCWIGPHFLGSEEWKGEMFVPCPSSIPWLCYLIFTPSSQVGVIIFISQFKKLRLSEVKLLKVTVHFTSPASPSSVVCTPYSTPVMVVSLCSSSNICAISSVPRSLALVINSNISLHSDLWWHVNAERSSWWLYIKKNIISYAIFSKMHHYFRYHPERQTLPINQWHDSFVRCILTSEMLNIEKNIFLGLMKHSISGLSPVFLPRLFLFVALITIWHDVCFLCYLISPQ